VLIPTRDQCKNIQSYRKSATCFDLSGHLQVGIRQRKWKIMQWLVTSWMIIVNSKIGRKSVQKWLKCTAQNTCICSHSSLKAASVERHLRLHTFALVVVYVGVGVCEHYDTIWLVAGHLKFHYNQTRITNALHKELRIFMRISRSSLLRMRNVSDKVI
jgi:hypothetical protein